MWTRPHLGPAQMIGLGPSHPKKKGLLGCHSSWIETWMVGPSPAQFIFDNNYYIILYNKKIKIQRKRGKI